MSEVLTLRPNVVSITDAKLKRAPLRCKLPSGAEVPFERDVSAYVSQFVMVDQIVHDIFYTEGEQSNFFQPAELDLVRGRVYETTIRDNEGKEHKIRDTEPGSARMSEEFFRLWCDARETPTLFEHIQRLNSLFLGLLNDNGEIPMSVVKQIRHNRLGHPLTITSTPREAHVVNGVYYNMIIKL